MGLTSRRFSGHSADALWALVTQSAASPHKLEELQAELLLRSSKKAKGALLQCQNYLRAHAAVQERSRHEAVVMDGLLNEQEDIWGKFELISFPNMRFTVTWELRKGSHATLSDRTLDCRLGLVISEYERFLGRAFVQAPISQLAESLGEISEGAICELEALAAAHGKLLNTWIVPSTIPRARPWWIQDHFGPRKMI